MNEQDKNLTPYDLNLKGNECYTKADYKAAIEYYKLTVEKQPSFIDAYYNLGLAYKMLNERPTSIEFFQKTLDMDPHYTDALNEMGIYYLNISDYDRAEYYFLEAKKNKPTAQYLVFNLALVEKNRGNMEKNFNYLLEALKMNPSDEKTLNELGNYYYNQADYTKAKEYYRKAIFNNPKYKHSLYNLGLIAEVESDMEEAKRLYEKSLESDPNYSLAKEALSKLLIKYDEAISVLGNKTSKPENTTTNTEIPIPEDSFIQRIGRNLNDAARDGKLAECIGRDNEIQTIYEVIYKRFKNNPVILGNAGTGKTAIVEGIAKRIVEGRVPDFLKKKQIIEINTGFLVAGTKYRGDLEIKLKKIIDEATANRNIILFIDELHTIMGAGRTEGDNLDMAQMLKPALARGEITCIGATTTNEYRKYIESDAALERRFYPVNIAELSAECTKTILKSGISKAQEYYKLTITDKNVDEIVDLSVKHIKKRFLPDKAIDIFEKVAARQSINGKKEILSADIKEMVGEIAGIKLIEGEDERVNLINLEANLKKEVFGQDQAIDSMCNLLRIAKRRLDLRPERPDGVFLFTGPTGSGKTYLAKCLCKYMFGDEKRLIRLDMSEFNEPHSISRLLGAPPGYIGYDEVPVFTALVEDKPTSILLLDEIEKAHPNVIKLCLQIFDDGVLTDSKGKKLYFSDVTVIMTSNALTQDKVSVGFATSGEPVEKENREKLERTVTSLSSYFPKEFLNRIDEIILFNYLTPEDIEKILENNILKQTRERFKGEGIELIFDSSVSKAVIQAGYNRELGARNLQRTFEKLIMAPLINEVYKIDCKGMKLSIAWDNGKLLIRGIP